MGFTVGIASLALVLKLLEFYATSCAKWSVLACNTPFGAGLVLNTWDMTIEAAEMLPYWVAKAVLVWSTILLAMNIRVTRGSLFFRPIGSTPHVRSSTRVAGRAHLRIDRSMLDISTISTNCACLH